LQSTNFAHTQQMISQKFLRLKCGNGSCVTVLLDTKLANAQLMIHQMLFAHIVRQHAAYMIDLY